MRAESIKFAFGIGTSLCRSASQVERGASPGMRGVAAKFGYHAAKQYKNFKSRISHG
jgi:hypothetical protein